MKSKISLDKRMIDLISLDKRITIDLKRTFSNIKIKKKDFEQLLKDLKNPQNSKIKPIMPYTAIMCPICGKIVTDLSSHLENSHFRYHTSKGTAENQDFSLYSVKSPFFMSGNYVGK